LYKENTKDGYDAKVLKVTTVPLVVWGRETGIMRETEIEDRSKRGSEMRFLGNVAGYKKQDRRGKKEWEKN